jgi:hypothetical protein
MSKQWYFQVMGAELGPVTSAELKEKVKRGQIQPETLVRLGNDGKWQPASRVKGLLDDPATPAPTPERAAKAGPAVAKAEAAPPPPVASPPAHAPPREERTYHLVGQAASEAAATPDERDSGEYDFFRFVGFELAIGHALHDVLLSHCHQHQLSVTQVTRRALAEFLGRKDLAEEKPAGPPDVAEGVS